MKNKIIKSTKFVIRATLHPSYGSEQVKLFRDRRSINKKRYEDYIKWFDKHKVTDGNLNCKENTPRNLSNVH